MRWICTGENGLQVVEINAHCKSLEVIQTSWGQMKLGKKADLPIQPQETINPSLLSCPSAVIYSEKEWSVGFYQSTLKAIFPTLKERFFPKPLALCWGNLSIGDVILIIFGINVV